MSQSILERCHCRLLRLVLESVTPLSIGTGRGNGVFDNLLVRDPNGLPGIPGTSLAGVLRHRLTKLDEAWADDLFGSGRAANEAASRVHVSWGHIHDSQDKPVEGLLEAGQPRLQDSLLREAAGETPLRRDRVRLDHRGTAASGGQFDRVALHAGYRFSVELTCWSEAGTDEAWDGLTRLLKSDLRLGGAVRSGFGAMKIVRGHHRHFNLKDKADFRAFRDLNPDLDTTPGWQAADYTRNAPAWVTLTLAAEDGFRFGGGNQPLPQREANLPRLIPVREKVVIWSEDNRASWGERLLIPASGIKGALRHRFAFHYRRLSGTWANADSNSENLDPCEGEVALFGSAANDPPETTGDSTQNDGHPKKTAVVQEDESHCGRLVIDDLFLDLPERASALTHNGIDRFTGGVRNHVLYTEQVVNEGFKLVIRLDDDHHPDLNLPHVLPAFAATLDDLAQGRLALGAGGARGWGFFEGKINWENEKGGCHDHH